MAQNREDEAIANLGSEFLKAWKKKKKKKKEKEDVRERVG